MFLKKQDNYAHKYNPQDNFLKKLLHLLKTNKTIIVCQPDKMQEYHIARWLVLLVYSAGIGFITWSGFITYAYFTNNGAFSGGMDVISEYKEKHTKVLNEVIAYKDAMKSASIKRENEYKRLVSLLQNNKSISELEKTKYLREQSLLLAEVNFLSEKLEDYIASSNLRKVDIKDPYYKLTRAEIQRDVSWQEQQAVQKKNDELIQLSLDIKEAQNKLLDKVEILAKDGLQDVESVLKKLDRSFAQIDLRSRERLLQQASKLEEGFGGPFVPIEKTNLQDDELDTRYTQANKQVDRWDGLLKVKSILPIGYPSQHKYITSNFGVREDPFLKTPAMHRGVDFKGTIGAPLFTTAPGKVIRAHTAADYGMFVEVDHGMGFTTLYAHMSKVLVEVGDQLNTGDKVGLAGSTGRSTGPHLHYEVRYKNRPINPYSFVVANEN